MSSLGEMLKSLKPYVIGIRYVEGSEVVDTIFKEEWQIPKDSNVEVIKGKEPDNYYMLIGKFDTVTVDDLLSFVSRTIALNIEREKKLALLNVKVKEMQILFNKTPLEKLETMTFKFKENDMTSKMSDISLDIDETNIELPNQEVEQPVVDEAPSEAPSEINENTLLDENKQPIAKTEEELEMEEEDRRAEVNRVFVEEQKKKRSESNKKKPVPNKIVNKVELPPRSIDVMDPPNCACGEDEACNKCMDSKY